MLRLSLSAIFFFAIDQASKYWIVQVRGLLPGESIEVLPPYLVFVMAWNTGINFGIFDLGPQAGRWILIALSLAIVTAVIFWLRKAEGWIVPISGGAIVGGALGNVLDRIVYGAVADFLNMSCCGISNPFAFNIADVAIFGGAAGLVLFMGGDEKKT